MMTLTIVIGSHEDYPLQCWNRGAQSAPVFLADDVMTAYVYRGQDQSTVFSPTVAWYTKNSTQTGYDQGQVLVTITSAQAALLSENGEYSLIVWRTPNGSAETEAVWRGNLIASPASGPAIAPLTNLAQTYYVLRAMSQIALQPGELDYLEDNIAAASSLFRAYCGRQFTQGTYIETVPVQLNGTIRLREFPVNWVTRIQSLPVTALTVGNTTATSAWVSLAVTGDVYVGLTITGMILNWQSGGQTYSQTITYTANETISSLAAAIAAVSGWTAEAESTYGDWPVTEIMDGEASKGAGSSDQPYGAALFHVFSNNITNGRPLSDDGQRTGIWWVGRQYDGVGPTWGPGWESDNYEMSLGKVKVTYNGGFATIPTDVQMAVSELVKANYERLRTDAYLKSESDGQYRYDLAAEMVGNLPRAARETAERYRVQNA